MTLLGHLGDRGSQVREEHAADGDGTDDFDPDFDLDEDAREPEPSVSGDD